MTGGALYRGLNFPSGFALDGSGDVFVADLDNSRVVELPAGGTQTVLPFSGLNGARGVAHGDGIVSAADKRVALAYRPSSSLAKKTAAFRRISRSIRSFAFSSRSRASSSRSS